MGAAVKIAVGKAALALVLDASYGEMLHTDCGLVVGVATLNKDHVIMPKCVICPYTVSLSAVRPGAANPADEIASIFMAHKEASLRYDRECTFIAAKETAAAAAAAAAANKGATRNASNNNKTSFTQLPDDAVSFLQDYDVLTTPGVKYMV